MKVLENFCTVMALVFVASCFSFCWARGYTQYSLALTAGMSGVFLVVSLFVLEEAKSGKKD